MGISAEELNIILQVRDRQFQKAMESSERRVAKFSRKSGRNLKKTEAAFSALTKAAVILGPALAGAFSFRAVQGAASIAREIQSLSNMAGIGAEEFQKLAIAGDTVGFSQEKMADIFKDVNDKFGDFMATGAGPLKDFFENIAPAVGVTAEQFAKLSGPEALQLYVTSLERAGVGQQQMTFYMEALASDATNLIPLLKNNGEEMRRLGDEAERSGRILGTDAVEAGARLDTKLKELSDTFTKKFQQAILDNADEIEDFADVAVPAMVGAMSSIGTTAVSVAGHISELAGEIASLAAEAESFYNRISEWAKNSGLTIERFYPDGKVPDWLNALQGNPARTTTKPLLRSRGSNRTSVNDALYGSTEGTGLTDVVLPGTGVVKRPGTSSGGSSAKKSSGGGRSGGGGSSRDALADLIQEIALNEQLLGVSESRAEVMRRLGVDAKNYNAEEIDAVVARVQAYEAEKDALQEIQDQQQAVADTIEQSLTSAWMSAIDGTQSFEDAMRNMAKSVISELMRVLVVQQMVGSFDATSGKGSGIVGAIMGAFSGRASGGSVMAGQAYRVGEHGPEPFIPAQNGRILSVAQAKSALGGGQGGQTVNQTINVTTGVQQTVRAEIKSLMPQITEAAVAATRADKMRRVS